MFIITLVDGWSLIWVLLCFHLVWKGGGDNWGFLDFSCTSPVFLSTLLLVFYLLYLDIIIEKSTSPSGQCMKYMTFRSSMSHERDLLADTR